MRGTYTNRESDAVKIHRCKGSWSLGVDVYKRWGSLATPALAKGTASVMSVSGAERAAIAQHKALGPKACDEARCEGEMSP
jgi:hypothetical protein